MNNTQYFFESIDAICSNKMQADAVKSIFKACFEDGAPDKIIMNYSETDQSDEDNNENQGKFEDPNAGWMSHDVKNLLDPTTAKSKLLRRRLADSKKRKTGSEISEDDERYMRNAGSATANGNYYGAQKFSEDAIAENNDEQKKEKIKKIQRMLNKKYPELNLDVDGKWGPKTDAAWKRYKSGIPENTVVVDKKPNFDPAHEPGQQIRSGSQSTRGDAATNAASTARAYANADAMKEGRYPLGGAPKSVPEEKDEPNYSYNAGY